MFEYGQSKKKELYSVHHVKEDAKSTRQIANFLETKHHPPPPHIIPILHFIIKNLWGEMEIHTSTYHKSSVVPPVRAKLVG